MKSFWFVIFILFSQTALAADRFDIGGEISFENLNFVHNRSRHSLNDQETLEVYGLLDYQKNNFSLYLKPRLKVDFIDSSRNRYLPNEAFTKYQTGDFSWQGGFFLKPQGVSNLFQPTSVLNRRDFEDLFYDPERLGELMFGSRFQKNDFGFEFLALPWFQETPLPENDTRFALRGGGLVGFRKDDNQARPDTYLQALGLFVKAWKQFGKFDAEIMYYHGPERDPAYFITTNSSGALRLRPFYYSLDMLGANLSYTWGDFLFRSEFAYKNTARSKYVTNTLAGPQSSVTPTSYVQFVPGLDYSKTLFGGHLATVSIEYYFEDNSEVILREFRPFKNDLFVGLNYQFNDSLQNQIQLGFVKDLGHQELVAKASWALVFAKNFSFEIAGTVVRRDSGSTTPLGFFENNSYVLAKIGYKQIQSLAQ